MIWYLSIANVRDNWPDDTGFIWNREMGSQGQQKRPRTGILTDESVYLHLPENALDILIGAFLDRANQGEMLEPADLSPAEVAWCRCVFALITMGCLAGQQALEEIFGLQFRDVLPISAGYILIPRAGGHYPIYVPQSVIPFVLSLLNHLTRGRGPGRNRQGTFPEDGFVLPRREVPTRMVGLDEHRHYQEMFRAWLMGLGKSVGFYIPVGRLISLARGRVLRHYSPPIAATLLGIHLLNPASVDQEGAVQLYRLELDWEWVVGQKLGSTALNARPHHRLSGKNVPAKAVCHPDLPGCLLQLKQIVSIYGTAEKTLARTIRRQVIRNLHHFALGEELTAGKKAGEDWSQFFQRHAARGFTWYQVDAINTCLLAQWFITQIRSHVPNTVNARLADIMLVMRQHPTRMLVHIEVKDILDSIGESMVASSRRARVGDSLKQFYRYIQTTLGIQVPEIAWWKLRDQPVIREYRLLTQPEFTRLLAYIYRLRKSGHIAVAALLIGYYFGLRVSEISRLRIGDLWIGGTPTVIVRPSKRGHSRFVEGIQIPPSAIQFLQGVRTARLLKEGGEYSALLLVDDQNKQLTTHSLIRLMSNGLVAAGIKNSVVSLHSAVHLLRHACANRWWAFGVPLIDITHKLGHRSPDTTIRTYLHIAPFLQHEECSRIREPEIGFSKKGIAFLLGITVARQSQLERMMFSPLGRGQDGKMGKYSLEYTIEALESLLALTKEKSTTTI